MLGILKDELEDEIVDVEEADVEEAVVGVVELEDE